MSESSVSLSGPSKPALIDFSSHSKPKLDIPRQRVVAREVVHRIRPSRAEMLNSLRQRQSRAFVVTHPKQPRSNGVPRISIAGRELEAARS